MNFLREGMPDYVKAMIAVHHAAAEAYQPAPYEGDVMLIRTPSEYSDFDSTLGWGAIATGQVREWQIDSLHAELMRGDNLAKVAAAIVEALEA